MRIFSYTLLIFYFIFFTACKSKKGNVAASNESAVGNKSAESNQSEPAIGLNLGNKAPEISLKNFSDSLINLSSVKGKLVLVDFWASWCGPCRHENPVVVKVYNEFKDKKFKSGDGFTIFSVSLDADKNKWKQAIEKDNLTWPYHVSDLKVWSSEVVAKYNIQGIPTNVLINDKGIIIDKNLRGAALEEALNKFVIN
jgi:thiol-disulfide isomerase/thioredoxin